MMPWYRFSTDLGDCGGETAINLIRRAALGIRADTILIGRVSLPRENEAGAVGGRKSIFFMLTYRTSFCFWLE